MEVHNNIPGSAPHRDELSYLHARIDILIRQTALEIGLLEIKAGQARDDASYSRDYAQRLIEAAQKRFWEADTGAGASYGAKRRGP